MCLPFLAAIPAALGIGGGAAAGAAGAATGLGGIASTIGTVASIGGTVVSALGAIQQGKAAAAAANYNAQVQEAQAKDAVERGAEDAKTARRRTAAVIGEQKATLAAGNLSINSGSALDLLGDTAAAGELEALTVTNNAERDAVALRSGANLSRMEASSAKSAGMLGAFGTALSGTATVADKWYKMKNARVA